MNSWILALLIISGSLLISHIVTHISYTICWKNCDNEMKERLMNKKSVTQPEKGNK